MSSQFGACTFLVISFLRFLITIWWQKEPTHIKNSIHCIQWEREREGQTRGTDRNREREYILMYLYYTFFLKANFLRFRPTLCVLSKTANLLRATQTADKPDDLFPSGAEDKKKIVFKFSLDGSGIWSNVLISNIYKFTSSNEIKLTIWVLRVWCFWQGVQVISGVLSIAGSL